MRKPKPLQFKRGDEVIFLRLDGYGIDVTRGVVSATNNVKRTVNVKYKSVHGTEFKTSFGENPGYFQEKPRPLWHLLPLNGHNFRKMSGRAARAVREYKDYEEKVREMDSQLETDARNWKYAEREKRLQLIPDRSYRYLHRVAARMGFKQPRKK
jgi:hypothetical protein